MKLTKKFGNLVERVQARIERRNTGSLNSNRGSTDSASGARNSGQGSNAEQMAQTALGSGIMLNREATASPAPDVIPYQIASDMLGNTKGQVSGREAGSEDDRVQDSDTNSTPKDILKLVWTGMEMMLRKVEPFLDGTPAKAPVAAINALIAVKNAVGDNRGAVEQLIVQMTERLLALTEALNRGVPKSSTPRMKAFIEILGKEIRELKRISDKGTFRQILENEVDKKAVENSFKRIEQATKNFQIDIALATEKKVDQILSEIKLAKLERFRAAKAIYNADLGGEVTVPREPCTKGTREHILGDIIKWAEDSSLGCPSVFWLTGNAGSGKTTIAYTIAQYFEELEKTGEHTILGGTFYCSRQFSETRQQVYIIPTLAYELAQKSASYCQALYNTDKFDSVNKLDKQIEDLFAGLWQQSASQRHVELPAYLIIVDALDEINDQGGSKFLHSILETIKNQHLPGLKFLFTSRPDPSITTLFDPYLSKALYYLQDVPIEHVGNDIAKFLQIKLPKFTSIELDNLVQLADGLFISAATIVRYLTPHPSITLGEQHKHLHKLYHGKANKGLLVDQLYQQILYDAFSSFDDDLFNSRLHILHTFLCTSERTSTSVTAALLAELDVDTDVVNAVLETLYAVLYYKNGQVLWYHASFPDFIFSKTRSNFTLGGLQFSMTCNPTQHHTFLAKSCFRIMKHSLRFNIGDIPSSFKLDIEDLQLTQRVASNITAFLRYACQYWSFHVTQSNQENSKDLTSLIKDFLQINVLFWIEAMNLLGTSGQCTTMLQHMRIWVLKNTTNELELAANLAEASNFATHFTANPPRLSTPHLYISSLATWSTGNPISQTWKDTFPGLPSFKHKKTGNTPLMKIQTGARILSAVFSSNDTHIVCGLEDNSVWVWDAATRAELKVFHGHQNNIRSIAFSPDGTCIVSSLSNDAMQMVNILTGAELIMFNGHTDIVSSIAFSLDGTHIVSGSYDNSVRIWDAVTGVEVMVLDGHTHYVTSAAFSPDGTYIVSSSYDTSVRVWNISTRAQLKVLKGHTSIVTSAALSPDGTLVVSGSYDKSVRVWDISTAAVLMVLHGHTDIVTSTAFSPDGALLVSGSDDNSVQVWDALNGAQLKIFNGHTHAIIYTAFSSDNTRIVSTSEDMSVQVWDASIRDEVMVINGHTDYVRSAAFSADGAYIVSGSGDNSVQVWNASTGAQLKILNGHTELVNSTAFSPDGTFIVSGSEDKSIRIWHSSTGAEIMVLNGHTAFVSSIAISPNGTHIVSGSGDNSMRLWDAATSAELMVLHSNAGMIWSTAFSPDGLHIVSGSHDNSVQVWETLTGALVKVLNGHTSHVWSTAFSPDSTCIVSGSADKSVRVWNMLSGAELLVLNGHTDHVWSTAFSPDGTQIVSGSADKSVQVWDVLTGALLKVFNGHTNIVMSTAFSPDGAFIVSGSHDKSVWVWDASILPQNNAVVVAQAEESAHLSEIVHQLYPSWTADSDQWLFSVQGGYRLMWVPQLAYPYSVSIISCQPPPLVSFHNCNIGPDWAKSYIHT